jgi:hypothetical protein
VAYLSNRGTTTLDTNRISKAKGQFNLKVQHVLKPLEMYGQKSLVESALDVIKALNELAIYEAVGEQPPETLIRKLQNWQNSVEDNNNL